MKLHDFTTFMNEDGTQIVRVHARVSDHADHDEQSEWIEFQIAVEVPTIRNGALLRQEVLLQASESLRSLAKDFERIAYQAQT
jgi:hypothetical protein